MKLLKRLPWSQYDSPGFLQVDASSLILKSPRKIRLPKARPYLPTELGDFLPKQGGNF
jgi:hypothetical protein